METIARNEERFKQENIFDPARWGLSQEAINTLGESLAKLHDRYRPILCALALWFLTQIKIEWDMQYPQDPGLEENFGLEELPAISSRNIREMLKVILPLPKLPIKGLCKIITTGLVSRARSIGSRDRKIRESLQNQGSGN